MKLSCVNSSHFNVFNPCKVLKLTVIKRKLKGVLMFFFVALKYVYDYFGNVELGKGRPQKKLFY